MAAPARAASMAESAISAGVTGMAGCLSTVSPAPVIAQVMKAFQFIGSVLGLGVGLTNERIRRQRAPHLRAKSTSPAGMSRAARRSSYYDIEAR